MRCDLQENPHEKAGSAEPQNRVFTNHVFTNHVVYPRLSLVPSMAPERPHDIVGSGKFCALQNEVNGIPLATAMAARNETAEIDRYKLST